MRKADQYDAEEMVAQLRQLSKDDTPDALKVNRDTVDLNAVPDEKSLDRPSKYINLDPLHDSLLGQRLPVDDIFKKGLNPATGKPLTSTEKALTLASKGLVLSGAGVAGIALGFEGGRAVWIFYISLDDQKVIDPEGDAYNEFKLVPWASAERDEKDLKAVKNFMKETLPKVSKDISKKAGEATVSLTQGIFKVFASVVDEEAMDQRMKDKREKLEQE